LWHYAGTILASNILREILRGIPASWKRRMGKREVCMGIKEISKLSLGRVTHHLHRLRMDSLRTFTILPLMINITV
jgi:hypothetical protein